MSVSLRTWTSSDATTPFDSDSIESTGNDEQAVLYRVWALLLTRPGGLAIAYQAEPVGLLVGELVVPKEQSPIDLSALPQFEGGELDLGDVGAALPSELSDALRLDAARALSWLVVVPGTDVVRIGVDPLLGSNIDHWRELLDTASTPIHVDPSGAGIQINNQRLAQAVKQIVSPLLPSGVTARPNVSFRAHDQKLTIGMDLYASQLGDEIGSHALAKATATITYAMKRALVVWNVNGGAPVNSTRAALAACICTDATTTHYARAAIAMLAPIVGTLSMLTPAGPLIPFFDAIVAVGFVFGGNIAAVVVLDDTVDDLLTARLSDKCDKGDDDCRQIAANVGPFEVPDTGVLNLREIGETASYGPLVYLGFAGLDAARQPAKLTFTAGTWVPEIIHCEGISNRRMTTLWFENSGVYPLAVLGFKALNVDNSPILEVLRNGKPLDEGDVIESGHQVQYKVFLDTAASGYDPSRPVWLRIVTSVRVFDVDLNAKGAAEQPSDAQKEAWARAEKIRCSDRFGPGWRNEPHTDPIRFRPSDVVWERIEVSVRPGAGASDVWLQDEHGRKVVGAVVGAAPVRLAATVARAAAEAHTLPSLSIETGAPGDVVRMNARIGHPKRTLFVERRKLALPAALSRAASVGGELWLALEGGLYRARATRRRVTVKRVSQLTAGAEVFALSGRLLVRDATGVTLWGDRGASNRSHCIPSAARSIGQAGRGFFLATESAVFELRVRQRQVNVASYELPRATAVQASGGIVWARTFGHWRELRVAEEGEDMTGERSLSAGIHELGDVAVRVESCGALLTVLDRFETEADVAAPEEEEPGCNPRG